MADRNCKRKECGEYGFIDYRKKTQLIKTLIAFGIAFAILISGIIAFKTKNSILTVAAVLMCLPGAKLAVSYIILFNRHTPPIDEYTRIKEAIGDAEILSDLVVSSREKLMPVDFLFIYNGHISMMISANKPEPSYTTDYLKNLIKKVYKIESIKSYTNYDKFYANVKACATYERDESAQKKDKSAYKEVLIYCVS